jgi:hypothetical protein
MRDIRSGEGQVATEKHVERLPWPDDYSRWNVQAASRIFERYITYTLPQCTGCYLTRTWRGVESRLLWL